MKKFIAIVVILAGLGSAGWAYYARKNRPEPTATSMPVTRGDVVELVQATGTLEAVTKVDVGTQVSGVVQDLYADFNQIVRKGQLLARLDPSILQVQIESQEANVIRAQADLERLKVSLVDAEQKYERAKQMFAKELVPRTELEATEIAVQSAKAQIKSSEASLTQSRAALNQAKVNLGYTVISAPIDGIIISRNVEPGQTVAASMNAPVLYSLAADLTKMQVLANIDESDVGRMRPGQHVTFRVDAFPNDVFPGTVEQVRLQPTVVQNVVVYSTVIQVPNPQLKLKPGMTANVNIEIARRDDVLRVPAAAVRFRPTEAMFQVLNQEVPPEAQRGGGRFGGGPGGGRNGGGRGREGNAGGAQPAAGAPAAPAAAPSNAPAQSAAARPQGAAGNAEARGGGDRGSADPAGRGGGRGGFDPNMTPEERRKRMEERMASMTPEERARWQERMAQGGGRGFGPGGQGQGQGQGGARAQGQGGQAGAVAGRDMRRGITGNVTAGESVNSGATTIDSLFAPLQTVETRGRAWIYENKQLRSVPVRLGISDGTYQELIEGDLKEGQEVVVNFVTGLEPANRPGQTGGSNPLMGPQRGGGPGGGGGGNRGGGRGF